MRAIDVKSVFCVLWVVWWGATFVDGCATYVCAAGATCVCVPTYVVYVPTYVLFTIRFVSIPGPLNWKP